MINLSSFARRKFLQSTALLAASGTAFTASGSGRAMAKGDSPVGTELRRNYLNREQGQIHYWTAGQGPNLFLIHQSNRCEEEFENLIPFLSAHYRLIAIDLPGHGKSTDPAGPHDMDNLTSAVIDLADHLKLNRFHILGHHGGALVAMNVAAKFPVRVEKTILSGSSGPKTPEEAEAFKSNILARIKPFDWDGKAMEEMWGRVAALRSDGAQVKDVMMPYISGLKNRLRPHNVYQAFLNWDRNAALNALKGPVLLIQGEKDPFVSHQDRLLDILPDGQRATAPGCGAFMFYEQPEICANILKDFLG